MNDMTQAEQAMLSEWTRDAFHAAVHAGYVVAPWRPTDDACRVLRGYHTAGLTPAEAAQAFFSTRQ